MNYYDTYDYAYNTTSDSIVAGILAVYLIVLVVLFLFYIISYVFKGIGMYTIAKRQGMDYPWLAFIPFARKYLQGEIGGGITLKSKTIKNPGIWLLVMPFIFGVVNFVLYMAFWVIGVGAMANMFSGYGYAYGHDYYSPRMSGGMILGIIVLLVVWVIIAVLYGAVYKVLTVLINHQILEKFTSKNMSIAHAVLCIFVPMYESLCFFVIRNREFNPGMEPDMGRPFIQVPPPIMPPEGGPGPGPYQAAQDVQAPHAASLDGAPHPVESMHLADAAEDNMPGASDVPSDDMPRPVVPPAEETVIHNEPAEADTSVNQAQTVIELPQSPTEENQPVSAEAVINNEDSDTN